MRLTIFISSLLLWCQAALAQEVLTLEDAVRLGLQNNFSIRVAENDQQVATNNNQAGNAGMLPTLDLEASQNYQRQNIDLDIQGSEGTFNVSRDWAESDRLNAAARLNWTIFDGLGMFMAKNRLNSIQQWGELNTQQAVQNSVAQIQIAYYQIILEQERLAVLEANLEVSQRRRDFAQNRYEVGKGSKLDYLSAQVDFNSDQSLLIQQQERILNAKVDLNILLAREVESEFEPVDSIFVNEDLIYATLAEQLEKSNPEILKAMKDHNVAYYEFREQQANRYPSISLDLSYNYTTSDNEAGQLRSSTIDGVGYGLTARWNIFNGFNTNRQVQNARIDHQSTLLILEETKLELMGQLRKIYNNYVNNIQLVDLEEESLVVARENEEIAIDRFRLGASNSLELREAQRNLVSANSRLLNAIFSTKLAEIELQRLTGNLVKIQP